MANRPFVLSLPFLLLLASLPISYSVRSKALLVAAQILSNSGFLSMSLTLELIVETLAPESPSLTIFSPSDEAFIKNGQPSLSLLQFHFSPLPLPFQSLRSLPASSTIPTLLPNHSIVITSSPSESYVSLNRVKIDGSPIFDDGSLIIFGIHDFLDPGFRESGSINGVGCGELINGDAGYSFGEAIGVLRSRGYSVMASFLDLQLTGFKKPSALTVFAPPDEKVVGSLENNFDRFSSIFFRHVIGCKISWSDLEGSSYGAVLSAYLRGFTINVTTTGGNLMVNEASIASPDLYHDDWLFVHGLDRMLLIPEGVKEGAESPSVAETNAPGNGEF